MEGRVAGIYIGPEEEGPIKRLTEVRAVAGAGLEGDRYFKSPDVSDEQHDPTEEVTLITQEGIRAAGENAGLDITPEDTRRNILTSGIELKELLGRRFFVGDVELEGLEENPPCKHLQKLAGKPLLKPLIHDGGIRARILTDGVIKEGDPINPSPTGG